MLDTLKIIYQMIEEVNQSNDKEDILRKNLQDPIFGETLRRVLEYLTDKSLKFPLNRIKYCIYFEDKIAAEHQNVPGIFQMLDFIAAKEIDLSDDEITFFERVSSSDPETVEVITRILNKESGCGLVNDRIVEILEETNVE